MSEKAVSEVWVVFTKRAGEIVFYGAVESAEKAKADIQHLDLIGTERFDCAPVMLVGWSFNRETGRKYSNDDPTPGGTGTKQ